MKAGVARSPSPNHSGTISGSPKSGADTSPIFDIGKAVIEGRTPCGRPGISAGLETALLLDKETSGWTEGARTLAGGAEAGKRVFCRSAHSSYGAYVTGSAVVYLIRSMAKAELTS